MLPEEAGIGALPPVRASLASVRESVGAGDLADQLGGGQRTAAAFFEQLRGVAFDERGEFCLEFADALGAWL